MFPFLMKVMITLEESLKRIGSWSYSGFVKKEVFLGQPKKRYAFHMEDIES